MRVLVVDDEACVRKLLRAVLVVHGYEVIEAENGLQGLQVAKCLPCDLVITDQIMPLLNGLDVISRLATERYPARYLLISGYGVNQGVPPGLSFLRKPFTSSQLINAVERLRQEPTLPDLEKQWLEAKAQWAEACTAVKDIISDAPSGIPHPDGTQRIERATARQYFTYENYSQAFHRYRETLQACGVLGASTETSDTSPESVMRKRRAKHPVKSKSASLIQPAINWALVGYSEIVLTERESEVLYLMAEGLATKTIARQLRIAFKTASSHRSNILKKLGVGTTVAAVRWAIREGLIEP
jgi:DNA-binding NarL/FixJ family response regulator